MFWKVAGFSQPSPIEQILDKDEFTLEELLDEDDIIQECKSLNGRLVAFLRERSTVEQLVRYLVDPPLDADDAKRAYKYPFTACEVFCCEVEAVFNTLLEDSELMQLLFGLLDAPSPLSSKTAGYFGRVVGHLLLRKTNEVMQYLQDQPQLLQQLVKHVDTTSIAEILKRLVGADEQSSMMFLAQYATWLAETPLVDLLLANLAPGQPADAQANAADILCSIAHTQPSPLASKLTKPDSIAALFQHALSPEQEVLVPALDVCIALIEPRRSNQGLDEMPPMQDIVQKAKVEAVDAIVQYVPSLVHILQTATGTGPQETPYGLLRPPLGRARLKAVELLAVLLRSGSSSVETAVVSAGSIPLCLQLFASYPFNNLLHHCVVAMLVAVLTKGSTAMLQHVFVDCKLIEWMISLPIDIRPEAIPGQEELAAAKPVLRAGYLGHVSQIGGTLHSFTTHPHDQDADNQSLGGHSGSYGATPASVADPATRGTVASYLEGSQAWQSYLYDVLQPRLDLENTARWACGRPTATELAGLDSDGDEFQAEMELEHLGGMQPVLYHRYCMDEENVDVDDDEDEEEEEALLKRMTDGMGNIDLEGKGWQEAHMHGEHAAYADEDKEPGMQGEVLMSGSDRPLVMEDDDVLLASSDEEEAGPPVMESVVLSPSTPSSAGQPELQGSPDVGAHAGPNEGLKLQAAIGSPGNHVQQQPEVAGVGGGEVASAAWPPPPGSTSPVLKQS